MENRSTSCSTSIQEAARELAERLSIRLHFIPAGLTDAYQPLDRRICACFKAFARRAFMRRVRDERTERVTRPDAVHTLIQSWQSISEETVLSGWSIYNAQEEESP
jgi:hypothetical protein